LFPIILETGKLCVFFNWNFLELPPSFLATMEEYIKEARQTGSVSNRRLVSICFHEYVCNSDVVLSFNYLILITGCFGHYFIWVGVSCLLKNRNTEKPVKNLRNPKNQSLKKLKKKLKKLKIKNQYC